MTQQKNNNFSIALLIFIAVFGITNIPNNYAAIGNQSIFWFAMLTFYFIPIALIMAELASFKSNNNSGISGWVKIGTSKKLAFFCGWAYFIENIFYLPMLASRIPVFISWVFAPISSLTEIENTQGNINGIMTSASNPTLFLIFAFLFFLLSIFLSYYFENIFDKIGKYIGILSLIIAFGFIFITFASGIILMINPVKEVANPITFSNIHPTFTPVVISSLVWIIFAIGGVETMGSVVSQVKNPSKNLPKIVTIGAILVIVAYTAGIIGLSFIIKPEVLSNNALENAIPLMFTYAAISIGMNGIWGVIFLKFIMITQVLSTISASVLWFVATINVLFSDIEPGVFPDFLVKKDKNNKPLNAMLFSSVLILCFLIMSSTATEIYSLLYNMSTISMVIPFVLLIISYINFKRRGLSGSYVFIKNKVNAMIVGSILLAITSFALIFGIVDIQSLASGDFDTFINSFEIYFGGLLFFMLIGFSIYIRQKNKILFTIVILLIFAIASFIFNYLILIILLVIGFLFFIYTNRNKRQTK